MSPISENDKRIWEDYIANLNSFNINFKTNRNTLLYYPKKKASRKILLQNKLKPFNNGNLEPQGVIDLHGYRLQTAKIVLHKYILNAYEKNLRNILVITGKGYNNTGILKKEVPLWLNDNMLSTLLISFKIAPKKLGGDGALMVRIKNKNKFRST